MTSETYLDLTYDRKGQKRPSRPKLLKLTEVSMPHRNRKKTKLKVKERSQSNARERIYDDPAYTDDISHLALPLRRNSGPDKIEAGTFHKRKSNHKDNHYYTKRLEPPIYKRDGSSSSDNLPPDPGKNKRGQSLERANIIDRSPKKREKRDRSAKQRRNLSLDNTLSSSLRRSLEKSEQSLKTASIERTSKSKQKSSIQRQNASEGWNSCLAATSDSSKATENDETYSRRKDSKMQIGKRFLRGEIGIKSFNYYLIKEGLKSSKKFVEKQRNSLTRSDSKKLHTRSEENIYEEIFFVDKNSDDPEDHHSKYPDCELCMQECTKANCEYCFDDIRTRQQYFGSLGRNDRHPLITALGGLRAELHGGGSSMGAGGSNKFAHILEFQSYNPNNPGVYKIETTPVAFTSDYNPIHQFQPGGDKLKQITNYNHPQPPIPTSQIQLSQQHTNQIQMAAQQQQQQQQQRRTTRTVNQMIAPHLNTKSSSSSDSLHHKYARPDPTIGSLDLYEYQHPMLYGSTGGGIGNTNKNNISHNLPVTQYESPQIYKSDSKVSIISEYSVRSESSNRNFRCGEVSDSSLGDSMFSYSTQQRRYFGSSESCRFAFECRRCSLDGEKCSFSDTCRYECRNCDCSSSYFSSDFDDLNYNHRRRGDIIGGSQNSQRSYEYYNDSIDVKQNKYAQDFFKHVNDVKRSIYQAEIQGSNGIIDSYNSSIPPPKQIDTNKSINYDSQQQQPPRQFHRQQIPLTNNTNRSGDNGSPLKISSGHQPPKSYTTLPLMKDLNRDKKSSSITKRTSGTSQITDTSRKNLVNEKSNIVVGGGGENISNYGTYSGGYGGGNIPKIDKSIKYSDGKIYAKPTGILDKQEKQRDLTSDRNTVHSRKRETGAIPKLSSSTSSSCSPHQSISSSHQKNLNQEQNTIKQNIVVQQNQSKTPNTSPTKPTRKRQPNNNPDINQISLMTTSTSQSTNTSTYTIANTSVPATNNSTDDTKKIINSTTKEPTKKDDDDNNNKRTTTDKISSIQNYQQQQEKSSENHHKDISLRKYYQGDNDKMNLGHKDSIIIQKKQRRNEKINSKNEASLSASQPELCSSSVVVKVMTGDVDQLKGKKKLKSIKNTSSSSKSTISHRGYSQEYLTIDDDGDDEVFYDARNDESRKRDSKRKRSLGVPISSSSSSTLLTSLNKNINNSTTAVSTTTNNMISSSSAVKQSNDKKNNDKIIITNKKCEYQKNNLKDDRTPLKDKQKKSLTTMSLYSQTTTTTTTITSSSSFTSIATPTTAPSAVESSKTSILSTNTKNNNNKNCDNLIPQDDNLQPQALKMKSTILMPPTTLKYENENSLNENEKLSSTKQNKKDYLQQNKALRNSQLLATSSTKAQNNVAQQHVVTNSNDLSMKFKQIPHDLNVSNKGEIINNCESFSVNTKSNESGEHDHKQFSSESKANNIDIDEIDDDIVNDNNNSKISQNEGEFIKQEKKTGLSNDTEILATTIIATTVCTTTTVTATTTVSFTDITNTTTTTTTTLSSAVAAVVDTTSITNCADDEFSRITNAANVAGAILNRDQTEQQQQSIIKDQITKYQDTNNKNIDITSDAATSTDESYLTRTSEDRRDSNDLSSTADKIDISDLPLPALPPKRGRNRSKILASVHQQQQQTIIDSHHKNDYSDPRLQYAARRRESLETSTRNFNEKLEARKMHYHSMGHMGHHNLSAGTAAQSTSNSKPTYLFGENRYHHQQPHSNYLTKQQQQQQNNHVQAPATTAKLNNDEIYLNKSGWVQVNSKRINDENFSGNHNRKSNHSIRTENQNGFIGGASGNNLKNSIRVIQIGNTGDDLGGVGGIRDKLQQPVYAVPRITNSKIEELISRNEARRNMLTVNHRQYMKPGYKIIDPQIASLLNERPGFLPVKTFMDLESPPPITPILSPPPAFQDTKAKYRNLDAINSSNVRIQINPNCNGQQQQRHDPKTNKGMVFSRSFEYDRKPTDHYAETFSKSFDCNLSDKPSSVIPSIVPQKRDRSPNFGNLTGCSPNYLTKKETTRSRESSPKYQTQGGYLNTTNSIISGPIKEVPVYCNPRKLDKSKTTTSNSFDRNGRSRRAQFTRVTSTPNPPPPPVSRFRSFDTNINQRLNSCDSGARSDLSNDEIDDDDEHSSEFLSASYQSQSSFKQNKQRSLTPERYDSQGSQNSLRKQRSLTPESRSLTPEDRRKKGSQVSLSSRQNSRNNTLERKQKFEDKSLSASRSSSSSSYSGREHLDIAPSHRRATTRNPKTPEEHRIRRSRSLQLSEKSPNRTLGHKNGGQQISSSMNKQQSVRQLQQHQMRNTNFPPTIRPNQIITSDPLNTIIINNRNIRSNNDIDKSRSFDFDYSPYNNQKTNNVPIGGGGSGGVNRLDFDKSRSFDEDYREQSNKLRKYLTDNTQMGISQSNSILKSSGSSNNNSTTGLTPSIQTTAPRTSATGLERNAGSGSGGSSSGSGQRQTSPQNYGTRLCDHEMTYDMLRRTLDRSPIMDFSRDYDIPQSMKNRETINAGGNSELNFTSDRIYDHNLLKQQLLINNKQHLLNQSPSDSSYSLDRLNSSSRDSITPDSSEMKSIRDALNIAISDDRLRSEYALYRQQRSLIDRNNGSGSNASSCNQTGSTQAASVSRGSCTNTSKSNDYWPNCRGGVNKSKNIKSKQLKHQQHQLLNCRCNNCTGNTNCIETNNLTHNNTKLFILSDDNNYDDDDIDDYDSLYENVREINKIKNIIKSGNNNNNNNRNNKNSVKKIIGVEQKSQISCKNCNNLTNYHRNSNSNRELKVNSGGSGELKRVGSDGYYKKNENILKKKSSISLKQLNLHEHENRIVTKPPIYVHSTAPATINTLKLPVTPPAATTTIIFLGEREMPITRESTKNNLSPTTIMSSGYNHHQNCDDDVGSVSEDEGNFCSLDNAMISRQNTGYSPTMGSDYRSVRPTKIRLKIGTSNNYYYRIYKKQQSLSLPNLYIQTEFPSANLMDNESDKCDLFSSSLINQIRSVSSPSLTDNPLDINIKNKNNINNDDDNNQSTENYNNSPFTTTVSVNNQQNYPSVLQKFKRTFSQFSGVGGNNNSNNNGGINSNNNNNNNNTNNNKNIQQITNTSINLINNDIDSSGKYRFGPLIWRSSKERRKTKYNRRDKCNSGDSGIQIELENEETFMQDGQDESIESTITSTTTVQGNNSSSNSNTVNNTGLPIIVRGIRRTNSAKLTNSMKINFSGLTTAKAKALKKLDNSNEINFNNKLKPKRSLSQPTGLDRMARNDLDDSDTDSVSSHPDLHEAHRSIYAEILFPFTPAGPQELPLERGGLVEILRKDIGPWWYGKIKHDAVIEKILEPQQGWFPKDFVRIIPPPYFDHHNHNHQDQVINDIINDCHHQSDIINNHQSDKIENITNSILLISNNLEENSDMTTTTIKNLSDLTKTINNKSPSQNNNKNINSYNNITNNSNNCSSLPVAIATTAANQLKLVLHTNQNLRNSVIKELLETEINYVKLLSTLCLGYLREMRKRIDIFPTESLNLIFSNIENVWQFQQIFLNTLRKGIETGHIGQAFLDHQSGFLVYSNYCNSYPRALMELESYSSNKDAKIIFENIRVAENLSNLPLSAHLLAPIQRICRYPLHLAELVKHSPSTSSLVGLNENNSSNNSGNLSNFGDTKESLEIALNAMKKVTETVNEGKRHSEHLTRFQASFDNFQGPPIAFHSTRFFMQTDATRVSPNLWNNTYTLFLFDRQLIYCKKDILKRNHFIYKGRIFLDNCRILNLPDGKMFGVTLKNALRIYCESLNKWFDFCFRSASRKLRFLSTLAVERQFCGTNLFVSELVGNNDDDGDNLSDREYHSDYDTPLQTQQNSENNLNNLNWKTNLYDCDKIPIDCNGINSSTKLQKYCDTLPKKSKKQNNRNGRSNNGNSSSGDNNYDNYNNTSSLGRRKLGSWFRKAKSTNSTPTQSPTHNPNMIVFSSDSSSQSSPALDGGGTYKSTVVVQQGTTITK